MYQPSMDELAFFDMQPKAFALYEVFAQKLFVASPQSKIRVQKTQISFSNRAIFACVSFIRVKKKAQLPDPYIVITLGMPYPLESGRVAVKTEPYPGRWITHIVIGSVDELDDELFGWIQQAYQFAENK